MAESEQIIRELEDFYQAYIAAFNREDAAAFATYFAYPNTALSGGAGLRPIASDAEQRRLHGSLMAELHQRGWARSAADRVHVWPLAPQLAMLMADFSRYRADGGVLERGRACYTLRREAAGWKIVAVVEVKPPFLGPGGIPRAD